MFRLGQFLLIITSHDPLWSVCVGICFSREPALCINFLITSYFAVFRMFLGFSLWKVLSSPQPITVLCQDSLKPWRPGNVDVSSLCHELTAGLCVSLSHSRKTVKCANAQIHKKFSKQFIWLTALLLLTAFPLFIHSLVGSISAALSV